MFKMTASALKLDLSCLLTKSALRLKTDWIDMHAFLYNSSKLYYTHEDSKPLWPYKQYKRSFCFLFLFLMTCCFSTCACCLEDRHWAFFIISLNISYNVNYHKVTWCQCHHKYWHWKHLLLILMLFFFRLNQFITFDWFAVFKTDKIYVFLKGLKILFFLSLNSVQFSLISSHHKL